MDSIEGVATFVFDFNCSFMLYMLRVKPPLPWQPKMWIYLGNTLVKSIVRACGIGALHKSSYWQYQVIYKHSFIFESTLYTELTPVW